MIAQAVKSVGGGQTQANEVRLDPEPTTLADRVMDLYARNRVLSDRVSALEELTTGLLGDVNVLLKETGLKTR